MHQLTKPWSVRGLVERSEIALAQGLEPAAVWHHLLGDANVRRGGLQAADLDVEVAHGAQQAGDPLELGLEGHYLVWKDVLEDAQRGAQAARGNPRPVDLLGVLIPLPGLGASNEHCRLLVYDLGSTFT